MANPLDIIIPPVPAPLGGQGKRCPFDQRTYQGLSLPAQVLAIVNNCNRVAQGLAERTMWASEAACELERVAKMVKHTMDELALHYGD
jgi:hypothetical protein